jgi:hypothetical protein
MSKPYSDPFEDYTNGEGRLGIALLKDLGDFTPTIEKGSRSGA